MTTNHAHSCPWDVIGNEDHSSTTTTTTRMDHNRRQRQQRMGLQLARKRLLNAANQRTSRSTNSNTNTAILSHHPSSGGDLYLTGDSAQYSNCAFLDGHEVILGVNLQGEIDIFRLPRRHSIDTKESNPWGDENNKMKPLAGKLRLCTNNDTNYSVSSKYKLKPIRNGLAFVMGSPSGSFSIFATEHASTWCQTAFPIDCQRRVRQDTSRVHGNNYTQRNNNNNHRNHQQQNNSHGSSSSQDDWTPYMTRGWEIDALKQTPPEQGFAQHMLHHHNNNTAMMMEAPTEWRWKPQGDALWDFWETASSVLAVHAPQDYKGWSHSVGVLDSRTPSSSIQTVDLRYQNNNQLEGITATCFASERSIVTASVRPFGANHQYANNVLQIWDLRKFDQPLTETVLGDPVGTEIVAKQFYNTHLISYLTLGHQQGQVMITCASEDTHADARHADARHCWYDFGRQEIVRKVKDPTQPSFVHQSNFAIDSIVFATNPNQDFMAWYGMTEYSGKEIVRLYDLQRDAAGNLPHQHKNHQDKQSKASIKVVLPSKRQRTGQDDDPATDRHGLSRKVNPKRQNYSDDTSTTRSTSSSTSDNDDHVSDDDSCLDDSRDKEANYGCIPCMGQFRPKLTDRHGLSTRLSCLAVNDTGTGIIGGSYDGDIFVWRGV